MVHPLDENGKWQRIQTGRILRVPVPAAMTPQVNLITQTATEIYKANANNRPIRASASGSAKVLAKYKKNKQVALIEKTSSTWYKVIGPDGKQGYMQKSHLTFVKTKSNTTEEALSQSSGLSVNTINRRRNEAPGKVYTAEQVVPLCIGLNLPPILSNQLLEMANIRFNPKNQQHSIYRIVLDCMYMDPLDEVQKKILIMGGKPFKDIHKTE